ncbi:UNVERIFIED_CONTAM: hypothetical protein GTU68_039501 [Idotea baltica]|nr:hypothetical protein [Idotea baltica]
MSGALAAGEKSLDWVGVIALASVTALGGGTIRDVLLNRTDVFWIADTTFLWVILLSSFLTIAYVKFLKPPMNSLLIADALGLALFSIQGAQIAESEGAPFLIVVLMGILTGVAGGVLRDVLMNQIPFLFRASQPIYSVAAAGGILFYLLLQNFEVDAAIASWLGVAVIAALRLAAIVWKIKLPTFYVVNPDSN